MRKLAIALCVLFHNLSFAQSYCESYKPPSDACDFNAPDVEQAKCLLRPVKKLGHLSTPLQKLPEPLGSLLSSQSNLDGNQIAISIESLKNYLAKNNISENDVGGSLTILDEPRYFVIHDTSDFLGQLDQFPANINEISWAPNVLTDKEKVCHVWVNRLGQSATSIPFDSLPPNGTKYSACHKDKKAQFLHIENVQPRISKKSTPKLDEFAPQPGFTEAQMERLALIYVVASVRSGKWLIPAYHAAIDQGYKDGHDDPQNFNLNDFAAKLNVILGIN